MKLRILTAGIISAIALIQPSAVLSQPSPDGGPRPGFWQPEAQVDLVRDITLILTNETGLNLEYGDSEKGLSSLPPGGTANIIIRKGNSTGDIANIPINVMEGTTPLRYEYNVDPKTNVVTVRIGTSSGAAPLDRSVYIDEKGRVYSF
ncbi:hypothetical protein PN499_13080 [Kamptonema animale CS-326]|jgi:hypothetical protein|uniref:hypothetical protein n=1 Tax=Kamptonema TaxID=1501433 RepID=UPI0001DACDED|nr:MULTISPECIES: hypothetical protein [Kamptonema]MDB9512119.1 hypothetical protein [Kamptonema animale CS-326]CBN57576.1 exported hypothetical protein [Kamptonema sp. PCC 6506]